MTYIFDYEVFAHDWLVVFKDIESGAYLVAHNDNELVKSIMELQPFLIGFNNKHYDQFIHKAVLTDASPEEIKGLNDYIIHDGNGWEHPLVAGAKVYFDQADLMDDCQVGLSLKAIEAHLGMDIRETTVSFDIDRPLTPEELEEVIFYCKHDVDATERLYRLRENYLKTKISVGQMAGLSPQTSLYMTNAKLTAAFLGASGQKTFTDEREYRYPDNILREYIPTEVFAFFDRLHDPSIPDEEIFGSKYTFNIGECECTLGFGGIHGAIPHYTEESTDERSIRNQDVASYYPHLMTIDGYCSRNIPDPKVYADMLEERMQAKKNGDKAKANALKLVANTTYGGTLNKYNGLYDPLMARSVCITGQLRLLELTNHLVADCPSLKVIQLNTDGIMVSLDNSDIPTYQSICEEWQSRTGFELEEDRIDKIVQKDVNNYVEVGNDGNVKVKGGMLVRGIAPAGAFNVNNNAVVVARALKDYFVSGFPVEDTINYCDTLIDFQLVAKASGKYSAVYHEVDGERVPVQRCNRIYATSDTRYGTLVKIHATVGNAVKVGGLPTHCVIDNDNHLTIDAVDKDWYIRLAKRQIKDFLGIKPPKRNTRQINRLAKEALKIFDKENLMATTKTETTKKTAEPLNIYQKLISLRQDFYDAGITKSGLNTHAEFKYFQLEDIVPIAMPLFCKYGLFMQTNFNETNAYAVIIDANAPDNKLEFDIPIKYISEPAKFRMNEIQGVGAAITYYRRYLYMLVLDLVAPDEIDRDATERKPSAPAPAPAPAKPATPEERTAVKKALTDEDGNATDLQITALKKALKKLKDKDPSKEEFVQAVAVKTNGFTEISKSACEQLVLKINEMLAALAEEELQ